MARREPRYGSPTSQGENKVDDLIFEGFNSRVVALHRDSGQLIWQWRCPKGSGYVTLLLDGDRLIVSVMGYTYCLDPATGNQLWHNDLPGLGAGVASLASVRGCVQPLLDAAAAAAAEQEAAQHAAASGSA
jgi:outer membrane protein assembly factor BamB